jgi:predicted  nucleic acid-binding Zn-ribbon protein
MDCKHENTAEREKIFSNGTKHIERYCVDCGRHIQYVSQNKEYIFYFGKYKGKSLRDVLSEDYNYVYWLLENTEGSAQRKLQEAINNLSK